MLLSIVHGYFNKKTEPKLNELVMRAKAGEEEVMNDLLLAYAPFMKKTASRFCNRFIDEHDDEFSVAMNGFHEAVKEFNPENRASLTTFAHLIIRRRLIDYFRKEDASNQLLLYQQASSSIDESSSADQLFDGPSIEVFSVQRQAKERREEINRYQKLLGKYGLSFSVLEQSSPRHEDTRKMAIQIAQIIVETPQLSEYMLIKKRLPVKELEKLVAVSRKTIERHRKYIIAIVLLLKGDFLYLKEYVKGELL